MDDIKVQSNLIVLQTTVAFLLARESVHSAVALKELHDALTTQFIQAAQEQTPAHPNLALAMEVHLTQASDHIFGIAEGLRRLMDS